MPSVRFLAIAIAAALAVILGASFTRQYMANRPAADAAAPKTAAPGDAAPAASPTKPADASAAAGTPAAPGPAGTTTPSGDAAAAAKATSGSAPAASSPVASSPAAPAAAPPSPAGPAFDVVRVEPDGASVIAGRAPGGATVELLSGGVVHDRVVADPSGLFAMTPPAFPPGEHELTLRFTAPDGTQSTAPQAVTVGIAADKRARPMIAITTPGAATVVLSKPDAPATVAAAPPGAAPKGPVPASGTRPQTAPSAGSPAAAPPAAKPASPVQVAIDAVEAEEGGRLYVSGRALPGATLRLYLNDTYLASGAAGPDGRVTFSIAGGVTSGDYKVRIDDTDPATGKVKSRAEVPFAAPAQVASAAPAKEAAPASAASAGATSAAAKPTGPAAATPAAGAAGAATAPAPQATAAAPGAVTGHASPAGSAGASGTTVVQVPEVKTTQVVRGDSLWRISRRVYGQGTRYTVIYGANDAQIRNPNLIYPGQVFVLPGQDG